MPKVTISILAYEGLEHSRACLKSIFENSNGHDYEIILTDNGSTDGTAEFFREIKAQRPDSIRVVTNQDNLGFIEPNRKALELARGEYFVLLNNDVKVPRGWLAQLLQPFYRYPKAALSGPDGSCSELTPEFSGIPGRRVDYLEGSCLCGKTEILRRHGLFSEYLLFAYHEDSDLSLRMQELGYSIHRVPFRIQHVREATSKRVPQVKENALKNRDAMIKRWSGWRKGRTFDYTVVVRRKASSGDVLLASSVVKALSERCPKAIILVETDFKDIFVGNPRVIRSGPRLAPRGGRLIDLDMAYENRPGMHIIKAYEEEALLGPLEIRSEFFASKLCKDQARLRMGSGTWIAIHAGPTTWEGKNWREDRWQQLISILQSVGWKVLLVGNPGYSLESNLDMRGKTRVHQLGGYLRACNLFCGVDSFPMHLAQAVGTQVVPLFGVTSPEFILTFGSRAFPVSSDPSHQFTGIRHRLSGATHVPVTHNPMDTIEVDQVIEAIQFAMSPESVVV
jgi:GT2 family glycosyltransferase/ADP-heptose:LPS heptosyltransferase